MSSSDRGPGVKRSFLTMQKNGSVIPAGFCDGYFIAIRGKFSTVATATLVPKSKSISRQSCCIFGCWGDAQMYLKEMEIEGRDVEYGAFKTLDAATQYAFGQTPSTTTTEEEGGDQDQAVNMNATGGSSLSITRRKCTSGSTRIDAALSLSQSLSLSDLERLPQDTLTNIYRYLCPGSCSSKSIIEVISIIGMVSKNLYQTCTTYVQQEPLEFLYKEYSEDSISALGFFLRNAAKVETLFINRKTCTVSACVASLILEFSDLSQLKNIYLDFQDPLSWEYETDKKWHLIKERVVSIDYFEDFEKKSQIDFFRECIHHIVASGVPSLQKIKICASPIPVELYNALFLCAIDRLQELDVELEGSFWGDGDTIELVNERNKSKIKRIEQLIQTAPRLKKLLLSFDDSNPAYDDRISLKSLECEMNICSKSLECLKFIDDNGKGPVYDQKFTINCPNMTILCIRIDLSLFDPRCFIRDLNIKTIKEFHLCISDDSDDSLERVHSIRTGKKISDMLGQMTSLNDLRLKFNYRILLKSIILPSLERLRIDGYVTNLKYIFHRGASLKRLYLDIFELFNFKELNLNFDNLVEIIVRIESCDEDEPSDEVEENLVALTETIEYRMPKLERFKLHFQDKDEDCFLGIFSYLKLKSQSLKDIVVQSSLFSDLEFDCPLLETLNGDKTSSHTCI